MNIVLIGMPGCGKTTAGRIISKLLNIELVDSDDMIIRRKRKLIPKIIEETGEKGFRKLECEIIKEISKKDNCIIATGGGSVINDQNVVNLKKNGILVFIDRDINNIRPRENRPLTNSREKLMKIYEERYPMYVKAADIHIKADKSARETAKEIIRLVENRKKEI